MLDYIIVGIIIVIILYLWRKHRLHSEYVFDLLKPLSDHLNLVKIQDNSIFQRLYIYETNEIFDYFFTVVTLKRIFDPISYIFPNQESLIFEGILNKKTNSFVIKKSVSFSHQGIKFAKKHKGDYVGYHVYGNNIFYDFVKKYKIDIFYISYISKVLATNCKFSTKLYIEIRNIDALKDKINDFYHDLFKLLNEYEESSDKKVEETIKLYEKSVELKITKSNIKMRAEERKSEDKSQELLEKTAKRKNKKFKNKIIIAK